MNIAIFIICIVGIMISTLVMNYLFDKALQYPNESGSYYISILIVLFSIIAMSFNAYKYAVKSNETPTEYSINSKSKLL